MFLKKLIYFPESYCGITKGKRREVNKLLKCLALQEIIEDKSSYRNATDKYDIKSSTLESLVS